MSGSFATPFFDADADNTAQTIKASGGYLYWIEARNPNSTPAYLQLFDAAAPTVGTTVPTISLYVPEDGATSKNFKVPIEFATAIKYAATTTPTGNGDPATGLIVNATYG